MTHLVLIQKHVMQQEKHDSLTHSARTVKVHQALFKAGFRDLLCHPGLQQLQFLFFKEEISSLVAQNKVIYVL